MPGLFIMSGLINNEPLSYLDTYRISDTLNAVRVWIGEDSLLPKRPDARHQTVFQMLDNVVTKCEGHNSDIRLVVNAWASLDAAHESMISNLMLLATPNQALVDTDPYGPDSYWNIHLSFGQATSTLIANAMARIGLVADSTRATLTYHVRGGLGIGPWSDLVPVLHYMTTSNTGRMRIVWHIMEGDDVAEVCNELNRKLMAFGNDRVMTPWQSRAEFLTLVTSHLYICPHVMPASCDYFPTFAGVCTLEDIATPEETRTIYGG